jgi:hypothetical protein
MGAKKSPEQRLRASGLCYERLNFARVYPCPERGLIMIAMIIRDGMEAGRMRKLSISGFHACVKGAGGSREENDPSD